jgi:hypothetical protein
MQLADVYAAAFALLGVWDVSPSSLACCPRPKPMACGRAV